MEFRVLGPLEASDSGGALQLGPRKQRALLARLLLDADRTVAVERLLDDLWGHDLPDSAPKMVQIYVSGLRKVLPEGTLETRPPGYVLHVEPDGCDLHRFERLAVEGRAALAAGDAARAAEALREALALWRGPALAEFSEPFAGTERPRLEELNLTCLEDRIEADLALGRHDALVGELEALVSRHPLRERLLSQLMLALYRAGRQAEALAAYQAMRRRLDEELGLEPSPALRDLERSILRQEPQLGGAPEPAAEPATGATPGLAGRDRELARLRAELDRAHTGERRVVIVSGEPGVGKTALVEAFLASVVGEPGVVVGRGRCQRQLGPREPYGPVLDALARLADGTDGEAVMANVRERAPTWIAHLPWSGSGHDATGVTRDRMVREMVDALEHVAADRTVVLVIEDVEWSDVSTRELVDALVHRREPARLLVVLTCAPDAADPEAEPVGRFVRDVAMRGPAEALELRGLSEAAVAELLADRHPGGRLPEGLARLLWERTEGHPLLTRHLVDHWLHEGLLIDDGGALRLATDIAELAAGVPPGLRASIADRLSILPEADGELLRAAAVTGTEFAAAAVAAALAVPVDVVETRCTALAAGTGLIESAGVAEWADGTISARWRFTHALVQAAVEDLVPLDRRTRLHLRLGERLEDACGPGVPAAVVARHLLAGRAPDRAARFLRLAADAAFARRAYAEGIAHTREALAAVAQLADGPDQLRLEVELRSRLGQALVATGGWSDPEAEEHLERAGTVARRLGDNELLVTVLMSLATLREVRGEPAEALEVAEEGLRVTNSGAGQRVDTQELLACSHFHQGSFVRALRHAELGTELFAADESGGHYDTFPATLGDNAGVACHDWAALATWFLGQPDTALVRAHHALELANQPGRSYGLAPALAQVAVVHQLRREPESTLERAEATIAAARERGYAYRVAMGRILRGWALCALGGADDGITEMVSGLAAARASGAHMEDPYFLALLADGYLEVADIGAGLRAADEGLTVARREHSVFCDPELHRLRAGLLGAAGAASHEVRAELEQAIAVARRQHSRVLELRAAVDLASLHREEGEPDTARRIVAEVFETFTEGFDTPDLREAAAIVRGRPV